MFHTRAAILAHAEQMSQLAAERRAEAERVAKGEVSPGPTPVALTVARLHADADGYDTWRARFERWAEAY